MLRRNYIKILAGIIFLATVFLFSYFRLKPIYYQTVGYTYDQGRDFIKAIEQVVYRKPTFIGPTTGIMGIFHGAWWYYIIIIPFVLFQGNPIGFYYFNFFIHLLSLLIFAYFLKKYFDLLTALVISLLISLSGYFIFTSTFVGNNIMTIPSVLFFAIANFLILEKRVKKRLPLAFFTVGIFLGLIAEFEFSFGLFIIPIYLIMILIFAPIRKTVFKVKNGLAFLSGLFIIFSPRIFFEFRHQFLQTKTLLNFFVKPKLFTPKPYNDVFKDRLKLFIDYYKAIFTPEILSGLIIIVSILIILLALRKKAVLYRQSLVFFSLLIGLLFLLSTLYKDTFWPNYFEGVHYLFIMLIAVILAANIKKLAFVLSGIKVMLIGVMLLYGLFNFFGQFGKKSSPEGLVIRVKAVNYILEKQNSANKFCVKIYTPPVIPYTYDYLFTYNHLFKKTVIPDKDWVNNRCWFIIESDSYKKRRDEWLSSNLPVNTKTRLKTHINDVDVILYEKTD